MLMQTYHFLDNSFFHNEIETLHRTTFKVLLLSERAVLTVSTNGVGVIIISIIVITVIFKKNKINESSKKLFSKIIYGIEFK
jgi:hypothetical protein